MNDLKDRMVLAITAVTTALIFIGGALLVFMALLGIVKTTWGF